MEKRKVSVLVCCHKRDIMAETEPYMPIQVGRALADTDLGITADNTGENISSKNPSFCELTGIYWAWKNLREADVVGLCHYRRYFDFHGACQPFKPYTIFPTSQFSAADLSIPDSIIEAVDRGTVVMPRRENFPLTALAQFNEQHSCLDMNIVRDIIRQDFGDKYAKALWQVLVTGNRLSLCNMFLMNRANFDQYCTWLFHVLGRAEEYIHADDYPPYQKRIFGFLAERLLNVWVSAERRPVKYYPVMFFSDSQDRVSVIPAWKYGLGCVVNNTMNLMRRTEKKLKLMP